MTQPALRGGVRDARAGASRSDIDPLELRRRNIDPPGRRAAGHRRPSRRRGVRRRQPRPMHRPRRRRTCSATATGNALGDDWLVGTGTASSIHETAPPTEHISEAWATLRDDGVYEIAVGTVEFGEGTSTAHVQIAASMLGTTPSRVHLVQSDTDRTGFDTGAFASAGLFVAGNAVQRASAALARPHPRASPPRTPASTWQLLAAATTTWVVAVTRVSADRLPRGGRDTRDPVHRGAQGVRVAAQRHVERPRLPHRRAPGHRRDPHPLQRSGRRRRGGDQPGTGARPDRGRCRAGHRLRADRELPRRRQRA